MLRFIYYELMKLGSRALAAVFAILLALNALLCVYSIKSTDKIPSSSMKELMNLYKDSPDKITAEYEELQAFEKHRNQLIVEQARTRKSRLLARSASEPLRSRRL